MLSPDSFLLGLFLAVNLVSFLVMGWDKRRAQQTGDDRIPEGILFFMATLFGAVGVFLGMFVFRHKTRTWYFLFGVPIAVLQNVATLYVLSTFIR
jgi:uncharacterized membrane protein YsdA (DUF1294 family)